MMLVIMKRIMVMIVIVIVRVETLACSCCEFMPLPSVAGKRVTCVTPYLQQITMMAVVWGRK